MSDVESAYGAAIQSYCVEPRLASGVDRLGMPEPPVSAVTLAICTVAVSPEPVLVEAIAVPPSVADNSKVLVAAATT